MRQDKWIKNHAALYRVPPLILVCLFAICTLIVASYGLSSYHVIREQTEQNFVGRTGLSYIATKIRQTRIVEVQLPESSTLILTEEIGGQLFATKIHYNDGMLTESFGRHEPGAATFDTAISAVSSFTAIFLTDDLIELSLVDSDGRIYSMTVYVHFAEGIGH